MSHLKERLSDYREQAKILTKHHQMILASDVLDMIEQLIDDLEEDEKENGWIPVKYHEISEKERNETGIAKSIQYMLNCKMPDDEQEILVTDGKTVWKDMCCIDCDGYYLDSGYDWFDLTSWRPLPEPYKED